LFLCVDFLNLHDYVIFTSIFGVHLSNFFTVQGNAIRYIKKYLRILIFPYHLEVYTSDSFFLNGFPRSNCSKSFLHLQTKFEFSRTLCCMVRHIRSDNLKDCYNFINNFKISFLFSYLIRTSSCVPSRLFSSLV